MQDAEKNRIKQWKNVEVRKGVFCDELQLSDLPVLGDWTIKAEVGEEVMSLMKNVHRLVSLSFPNVLDEEEDRSGGRIRFTEIRCSNQCSGSL